MTESTDLAAVELSVGFGCSVHRCQVYHRLQTLPATSGHHSVLSVVWATEMFLSVLLYPFSNS